MTQPIVFTDCETTSLGPDRRVWEVAMIRRDHDGQRERRFFIANVDLANADPAALAIGRFYERHPQYAGSGTPRPPKSSILLDRFDACVEVERWTRGATIVGSNPGFDTETLAGMLRSVRLIPAWHYRSIDVAVMAAGWLLAKSHWTMQPHLIPDFPWRSEDLALACGVEPCPPEERHTALGDARWVARWWDTITGRPAPTLTDDELHEAVLGQGNQ